MACIPPTMSIWRPLLPRRVTLARLVQQMLDLSRMENSTAPLNLEPVDMVPFVRSIVNGQSVCLPTVTFVFALQMKPKGTTMSSRPIPT